MSFTISYTTSTNYNVIALRGGITIDTSIQMTSELNKKVLFQKDLLLDLSGVKFIDSSGLSLIINLENRLKACNKQLSILKPSEVVKKILRETNMLKVLTIIDSYETSEKL